MVERGGRPLLSWVLDAAAAFETVVVAKRSTDLPPLHAPVWLEPDEPSHPLCGLVAALARGPVIAVACDQPWVTPDLFARLAETPAVCSVEGEYEPFPGHYEPSQLSVLREALDAEASLRRTLATLAPARIEVPRELVASINTPEDLAAAERRLIQAQPTQPITRSRGPA